MKKIFLEKGTVGILLFCFVFMLLSFHVEALTKSEILEQINQYKEKIEKYSEEIDKMNSQHQEMLKKQRKEFPDVIHVLFGKVLLRRPFFVEFQENILSPTKTYAVIKNPITLKGDAGFIFDMMGQYSGVHSYVGNTTVNYKGYAIDAIVLGDVPNSYKKLQDNVKQLSDKIVEITKNKNEAELKKQALEIKLFEMGNTPSNWAKEEVEKAISENMIPNYLQSWYQNDITRQEFCELLIHILKNVYELNEEDILSLKNVEFPDISPFTDTDNRDVIIASQIGLVSGKGNNLFGPRDFITREQAAILLTRFLKIFGNGEGNDTLQAFSDFDTISQWAKEGVSLVSSCKTNNGRRIMNGSDGKFLPKNNYTREQAYMTVLRMLEYISERSSQSSDVADSDVQNEVFDTSVTWSENINRGIILNYDDYDLKFALTSGKIEDEDLTFTIETSEKDSSDFLVYAHTKDFKVENKTIFGTLIDNLENEYKFKISYDSDNMFDVDIDITKRKNEIDLLMWE